MQTQPFEKHVRAPPDLDAVRPDCRAVKARAGDRPLCAVVYADSYGQCSE